jgi:pimeloyl-ACP methyl ester carboxylesterase
MMNVYRVIGSPGYQVPDDVLRPRLEASIDRSYYPQGVGRQMLAILSDGSRVERLRRIKAPTLVIHGADDPLVPLAAGEYTARKGYAFSATNQLILRISRSRWTSAARRNGATKTAPLTRLQPRSARL